MPARAAGNIAVVVTFLLDADGVLRVSAKEPESGTNGSIKISPSGGLSKDKVSELAQALHRPA